MGCDLTKSELNARTSSDAPRARVERSSYSSAAVAEWLVVVAKEGDSEWRGETWRGGGSREGWFVDSGNVRRGITVRRLISCWC